MNADFSLAAFLRTFSLQNFTWITRSWSLSQELNRPARGRQSPHLALSPPGSRHTPRRDYGLSAPRRASVGCGRARSEHLPQGVPRSLLAASAVRLLAAVLHDVDDARFAPCQSVSDYVPFYFAPHSMMLFQIHTNQVKGCTASQKDIVFLVSSLQILKQQRVPFLFTDGHALMENTRYCEASTDLSALDWGTIKSKDFRKRMDDFDRSRRYQAECLVHRKVPLGAILGIACFDSNCLKVLEEIIKCSSESIQVKVKRSWYF